MKGQVSVEYLIMTGFVLVIIVVIFTISILNSSQTISTQLTSESLDNLVQTADLVYALGPNNVLLTEVSWPGEVTELGIVYMCKKGGTTPLYIGAELKGCPATGGQVEQIDGCTCTPIPGVVSCADNYDCIKNSAIKLTTIFAGATQYLIYTSRAKISSVPVVINNVKYKVKASYVYKTHDTSHNNYGFVKLENA